MSSANAGLIGGKQSFFRTKFVIAVVEGGLARQSIFMELPPAGYYGRRGQAILTNAVMTGFCLELREMERTDPVVTARGGVSFVQYVIVPEVILSLVMEDNDVDSSRALTIMAESDTIGFYVGD